MGESLGFFALPAQAQPALCQQEGPFSPHDRPVLVRVEVGPRDGSVQLCLFANRRLYPTRKAIWIRTACLAAAQRFSLKPAGSRWTNRTQRYRLNPCRTHSPGRTGISSFKSSPSLWAAAAAAWEFSSLRFIRLSCFKIGTCAYEPSARCATRRSWGRAGEL